MTAEDAGRSQEAAADVSRPAAARSPAAPGAAKSVRPLRDLLPFLRPYGLQIGLAVVFLLGAATATLAAPFAVRLLVDAGLSPAELKLDRLAAVREHFVLLFGIAVALGVFTAARFFMVTWIGERVTADLRQAVYAHVLTQSPQFFETLKTGEVLSRLTTDTTVIQNAVGSSVSMGLRNSVIGIGAIVMLVLTSPRLMLTVLAVIALVVAPAAIIGRRVQRLSRASQDRIADTSGIAGEVLNAIPVVQSFTQERAEVARFAAANESAFATSIRRTGMRSALTAFVIIGVFGSLLYGLYGGVQAVFAGRLSAGDLSQTTLYITLIAGSVAVLAEVWGDLLRASGATERLMELLATRSHITDPPAPLPLPAVAGTAETRAGAGVRTEPPAAVRADGRPDVRPDARVGVRVAFDQVRFVYPSRPGQPVLDALSIVIEPGQTVALVGPSGAGKTTVFQLLQRFYDIEAGRLSIDGVDVRHVRLADLRSRIAVVPQEAVIFSGTILDNIRYGRVDKAADAAADDATTGEQARAAARAAFVDEFVQRLPDGYATFVGERGVRLSGGQRQRIAIARAMLKDAPLLLLDEATSSLDAESERAVQAALDVAMRGRTTIVIAHRLSTVQAADRIFVLEQGRLVDAGTHAELVARGGLYARLAQLQFAA